MVYEVLLFWSFGLPQSLLDAIANFIFVIYCAYVLGWKAAVVTGVVIAALCLLVRHASLVYVGSMLVGAAAGVGLVGRDLWIPQLDPVWRCAAVCAFAAFVPTWAIYHESYLMPNRSAAGR